MTQQLIIWGCIIASVYGAVNIMNFYNWGIDYNPQNVGIKSATDVVISFSNAPFGGGSRMVGPALIQGSFCADVTVNAVSGTVFALYMSSGISYFLSFIFKTLMQKIHQVNQQIVLLTNGMNLISNFLIR